MLPRVSHAEHRGGFRIHLTFNDGAEGTVDFRRWLGSGPVFAPLKEVAYFRTFFLDGESVEWPNGASIAPEELYASVRRGAKRAVPKRLGARKGAGTKRAPLAPRRRAGS